MSAQNPFQIPSCFKLDIEQRRRERFKKTVVTSVIVSIAVVVGLLIEGCVSERSEVTPLPAQASAPQTPAPKAAPAQSARPAVSQTTLPTQPSPVAMEKTAAPVDPPHTTGGAVYLVKSGDSLTRIAKTHGTTIKALKSANNLESDRIVVGEKLKIPSA
jgi:5'-nucleotidase/UDP-sugar diphosphatase